MFSLVGLLLAGFGAFSDKKIYEISLGININLAWSGVLLVFGLLMLWPSLRSPRSGRR